MIEPGDICDVPDCEEQAIVRVNNYKACNEHLDETMGRAFAPLRLIKGGLEEED